MRQIHETQIEVTEVKFELEYIQTKFLMLSSKDKPEEFTQKAYDSPHPDLIVERQNIKKRLVEIFDLPEMPEGSGKMEDRFYIKKIQLDPENGKLKFDVAFKTPAFAKPVTMKTDWSNDFALETYSQFLQEVRQFITKQKRAQGDMFGGDSYEDHSGSKPGYQADEDHMIEGRNRALPEHGEVATV